MVLRSMAVPGSFVPAEDQGFLFAAITLPWYVLVSLNEGYGFDLLIRTNISRYFDTWTHAQPFYYYLKQPSHRNIQKVLGKMLWLFCSVHLPPSLLGAF